MALERMHASAASTRVGADGPVSAETVVRARAAAPHAAAARSERASGVKHAPRSCLYAVRTLRENLRSPMKMCVASCDTGFLLMNCSRSSDSGSDIPPRRGGPLPPFHLRAPSSHNVRGYLFFL